VSRTTYFLGCALVLAVASACRESSGVRNPQQLNYAVLNADVSRSQSGALTIHPAAFFFRAQPLNLPTSSDPSDGCQVEPVAPEGTRLPEFISAGDSVAFSVAGGATVYLKPEVDPLSKITSYTSPLGDIGITPGAQVTLTVPGVANGFPAASISVRTAEPFDMQGIPSDLQPGQSVNLTWTPGVQNTASKIEFIMQYQSQTGLGFDEQVYCLLNDDGEHSIPPSILTGFRTSGVKRVSATRFRTAFKDLVTSELLAVSSYVLPASGAQ
jgi:hypothetical protein